GQPSGVLGMPQRDDPRHDRQGGEGEVGLDRQVGEEVLAGQGLRTHAPQHPVREGHDAHGCREQPKPSVDPSRQHAGVFLLALGARSGGAVSRSPSLRNAIATPRVAMARVAHVNPSPPARTVLRRAALVALGGMLGTAARMGLGMLIPDAALGVLVANLAGALLLGVITARLPASDLRVFAGTGVLGGFTTYSAFAVDSVQLWASAPLLSIGYVGLSLVVGIAAAALGLHLGRKQARA